MTELYNSLPTVANACLLLADGTRLYGQAIGKPGATIGEICFNTSMTGYQEILTDPSYTGQLICFTFPHIGIIGTNDEDIESLEAYAAGLIVREPLTPPSNFRSTSDFNEWLKRNGVTGISGIDTRALTKHIRDNGAQNAAIVTWEGEDMPKMGDMAEQLASAPNMEGLELASMASCKDSYGWDSSEWVLGEGYPKTSEGEYNVVAIDFGQKLNILRCLTSRGCKVTALPGSSSADDILALKPDGIFISNGPGDPSATAAYASNVLKPLIDAGIPIFGICLGHQLIAHAVGGKTVKMKQGHRGANHPVKNLERNIVEITSQNHGFVVEAASLPENAEVTHFSLFDGTVEGLRLKDKPVFSVQYHPESSPGPHDSRYLFDDFVGMMQSST